MVPSAVDLHREAGLDSEGFRSSHWESPLVEINILKTLKDLDMFYLVF
jgi:hypothetical protein